jgi:PAS domain S-box-containing protein
MYPPIFEQDLKILLEQDTPPDAETWEQLRRALKDLEARAQIRDSLYAQFLHLFQASNIAQCLTETDGTIVDFNARATDIVGWERDAVGKSVLDLGIYADSAQRARLMEQFLRDGRVRDAEIKLRTKAGAERTVLANWDPFELEGHFYILSTFFDVTEMKRTETLLRESYATAERQAREFALLHEARTVLARSINVSNMLPAIVEAVAATFGYALVSLYLIERDRLILQHHHGYAHALGEIGLDRGVMARAVRHRQPILLTDVRTDPEFLSTLPDVTSELAVPLILNDEVVGVLNVETRGETVLGDADLRLMVALGEHIGMAVHRAQLYSSLAESERREREQRLFAEALRDTAAGLNATLELENMLDLIVKHLRRVMPPFQAVRVVFIYGSKTRVVAQRGYLEDAFTEGIDTPLIDCANEILRERKVCLYPDLWAAPGRADNPRQAWVRSLIGAPVVFNSRVIGIIYLDSDTPNTFHEKHADLLKAFADQAGIALQKAQLYKRLRRQTKMRMRQALEYERRVSETRAQFGIAVSHEFRTPLTTIQTSADLMRLYDERLSPERRSELLGKINTQVRHLTHLLDDIMLLSRSELIGVRLDFSTIDLDQLCREITADIQWIAGDKYRLIYFGDASCHAVTLDEALTSRILINLLTNAVKYSPEGGKVLITLNRDGDGAIIEVMDSGIGIPAADLPRLFETFHRAGNVGSIPGTGLGLTLVKQAAELQGGTIQVQSIEGVGSTFTVHLPITPRPPTKG